MCPPCRELTGDGGGGGVLFDFVAPWGYDSHSIVAKWTVDAGREGIGSCYKASEPSGEPSWWSASQGFVCPAASHGQARVGYSVVSQKEKWRNTSDDPPYLAYDSVATTSPQQGGRSAGLFAPVLAWALPADTRS